jgi:hypothetical protein
VYQKHPKIPVAPLRDPKQALLASRGVLVNPRRRNCLTLRRHLDGSRAWLGLLKFLFDHRRFMRSRRSERIGRSPREAMTGHDHPSWLTLLGLGPLQPRKI